MDFLPSRFTRTMCLLTLSVCTAVHAHELSPVGAHGNGTSVKNSDELLLAQLTVQAQTPPTSPFTTTGGRLTTLARPAQTSSFDAFAPKVATRWNDRFLFIESAGMPAHNMMVGIKNWQQQVPLPQTYTGSNAWQIPLTPVPAKEPVSIKGRFLRGAVAIAANGVPIFNPQNNRGEIAAEIGELDQWGGHCGRADDYHYHAAPLHLQSVLGNKLPIAYALDGYPIYGLTEPDGSTPSSLDSFNGHETEVVGYHYHASTRYPYVNGGFHGEVVELEGQVDPQPRARPVRDAGQPLRGASITGFEQTSPTGFKLSYEINGDKRAVLYVVNTDGTVAFEYQNGREGNSKQVYATKQGGGGPPKPRGANAPDAPIAPPAHPRENDPTTARGPRRDGPIETGPRKPWIQVHGTEIDVNGDGVITAEEFFGEAKRSFEGYDRNHDGKLTREEYAGPGGVRSPMGGFVKEHAAQIDANGDGVLTFEEFLNHVRPMFEKQDIKRDGKLTPDEWRDLPDSAATNSPQNRKERGPGGGTPRPRPDNPPRTQP